MDVQGIQWTDKFPWYNTTICTILNGKIFKEYLKTGCKDRYKLICAIDEYDGENESIPDDARSVSGIPMTSTSYRKELFSLVHRINFIKVPKITFSKKPL